MGAEVKISLAAIARRLGVSRQAVHQRVTAMERSGVQRVDAAKIVANGLPVDTDVAPSVYAIARAAGINPSSLWYRIYSGRSVEEAVAMGPPRARVRTETWDPAGAP